MKENLTEIICVVDKSGSMAPRTNDVIAGFNKFLEDQKKLPGDATLTLTLFDTHYRIVHSGETLKDVPPLDSSTYMAGGFTALLDAVGKTIDEVGERLHNTNEGDRPGKIIFLIITDGEENSSKEYHLDQVKKMIQRQQESYKWDFVFLGANQDAFAGAMKMGIPLINSVLINTATPQGVHDTYAGISNCVASYRSSGKLSPDRITSKS